MNSASTWIDSVNGIAEVAEVDWRTAKKWTSRADFPQRRKSGWKRIEVLEYAATAKESAAAAQTGDNRELKADKLRLECGKLRETIRREHELAEQAQIETQKRKGEVVPVGEVLAMLDEIAAATKAAFQHWLERIAGDKRDPDLLRWAEQERDRAQNALANMIGGITDAP
jgi:hypothetical protein